MPTSYMSATSAVAQKKAITNSLKAQAQDQAVAKKALVVEASESELFTDDITGDVYKAFPVVLTESDFTATSSTASAETTVLSYQVPNGVEYLFRAPTSNLDRNSPYLYGTFAITNSTVHLNGNIRMKVLDASQNDLKGQPFTGAASQINAGDAIDWNKCVAASRRTVLKVVLQLPQAHQGQSRRLHPHHPQIDNAVGNDQHHHHPGTTTGQAVVR